MKLSTPKRLVVALLSCGIAACQPASGPAQDVPPPRTAPPARPADAVRSDVPSPAADATSVAPTPAASAPPAQEEAASPPSGSADGGPTTADDSRTPVQDTTPQAAASVVQTYFAMLDARRVADADALWRDAAGATAFHRTFADLGSPRVEVGAPGPMDAAAGSAYITIPVLFVPPAGAANPRPRHGEVVLRRVNDVPGSTQAQRHWHIERIDVAMTPK